MEAWARVTGTHLPHHEARLLRRLSWEYCNQYAISNKDTPAPYSVKPVDQLDLGRRIFGALTGK